MPTDMVKSKCRYLQKKSNTHGWPKKPKECMYINLKINWKRLLPYIITSHMLRCITKFFTQSPFSAMLKNTKENEEDSNVCTPIHNSSMHVITLSGTCIQHIFIAFWLVHIGCTHSLWLYTKLQCNYIHHQVKPSTIVWVFSTHSALKNIYLVNKINSQYCPIFFP